MANTFLYFLRNRRTCYVRDLYSEGKNFFQKHKIRVAMANALSPTSPSPTPRAQDQVATLPLSGSFRCFELPFSRRGWPWCCIKFLFWGALEGDRLAALRRTGTVRTRGWVLSWRSGFRPPKKLTQTNVNIWTLLATTDAHTRAPSLVVPPRSKPLILMLLF